MTTSLDTLMSLSERLAVAEERNTYYRHFIAVLITKLGGSVTIKPKDIHAMETRHVTVTVHTDIVNDTLTYEITKS